MLPTLGDIDESHDLVLCRRQQDQFANCLPQARPDIISVVIPTRNEAASLEGTVRSILAHPNCEVIIADGESTDGTPELAEQLGCRVIRCSRGRGRQMNSGAAVSRGEYLLFLHADSKLPPDFEEQMYSIFDTDAVAGAFRFRVDHPSWGFRVVEWGTNLRSRLLQMPYGDQGLFLRSSDFFRLGGFPNWPLMEDVELCRRLRRVGRIGTSTAAMTTSPRRWLKFGLWRTTFINQFCLAGYYLGVSPQTLRTWYLACAERKPRRSWWPRFGE